MDMLIEVKELIYRRRKGFCLRIDENGDLIVIAPYYATENDIRKVIQKKANWILKTREVVLRNLQKTKPLKFVKGESILFLGENFKIDFHNKSDVLLDEKNKVLYLPYGEHTTLYRKLKLFLL